MKPATSMLGAMVLIAALVFAEREPSRAAGIQQTGTVPAAKSVERALVDQYCVTCHNRRMKTGGLALDDLDVNHVAADAATWEKAVRKLRAGVMPPAGRPRPDGKTLSTFITHLETELDRAASAAPNPGRTETFHRLNRTEYQNVVRHLLALDVDVASLLPADDATYGFDNIASALKVSPTLMERYLAAARKISRSAVGAPVTSPGVQTFRLAPDLSQEAQVEGLPFGTRGGTLVRYNFPQDGDYEIRAKLALDTQDNVPRYDEPHQLEIALDGRRLQVFTLPGEPDSAENSARGNDDFRQAGLRRNVDADWRVRVPVKAGPREVGVTFIEKTGALLEATRPGAFKPLHLALKQPFQRRYVGGFFNEETRSGPYLASVTITGPFSATGPGDTPSRRRIFICRPSDAGEEAPCARRILSGLARLAYRRPVTDADLRDLLRFFDEGRSEGFEAGIELALRRLLVNPAFLFRIERDPANTPPNTAYAVSDLTLASRLSFFLWSSIPDDELIDAATSGALRRPGGVERQVQRMLADPRSQAFVTNFTGQWLYVRNLPGVTPDQRLFPDFDEGLRQAFRQETELFFESIVREDHGVIDLLTADYTFLNERLARHYGIPNVKGTHFRRVSLAGAERRGILGHGSILAATSFPHRTSPVVRGKWILENLLGTPPPAPPPDVPDLKEKSAEGKVLSMRERMVQHRANPVCASCHAMMDPAGLALENFDAVGRWRVRGESFAAIDASGEMPDGTRFEGAAGLRAALLNRSGLFVTTLTEKLLTFALGRGLEPSDAPAVRDIVRTAAEREYRFSAVLMGIVNSVPFQMRRSAAAASSTVAAAAAR